VAADGSGKTALVPAGQVNDFPSAPGPDADSIIVVRVQSETSGDIFLLSISGRFPPKPLLMTPAYEGGAQLSPDRRWLLYQSNESGQPEIYVRRYPTLDREWQVSEGGGVQARWSHTGREIYFRSGRHMMSVALEASADEPKFGKPKAVFADEYQFGQSISIPNYDVTPDGRFIMLRGGAQGGSLRVVIHWTEELKQILAAGGVHWILVFIGSPRSAADSSRTTGYPSLREPLSNLRRQRLLSHSCCPSDLHTTRVACGSASPPARNHFGLPELRLEAVGDTEIITFESLPASWSR